ncbi:MAG: MarR family transcriptional regulator [Spirochaetia bacterium]
MGTVTKAGGRARADSMADAMQRQLWRLLRGLEHIDQEFLSRFGVTTSQGEALLAFPGESRASMNELSRALGLANSTMTRMVENLVTRGFVRRTEDEQDRRVVRVALTAEGRKLQGSLKEARREIQRLILAEIRVEDRTTVLEVLEKLNLASEKALKACCGG